MTDRAAWSTSEAVERAVRRRWDSGELLRSYARREPFVVLGVPLRGPTAPEVGTDLDRVRRWASGLERGSRRGHAYTLTTRTLGGRVVGRNEVPARAVVSTYEQAWHLLDVEAEVAALDHAAALTIARLPELETWVVEHPLRVVASAGSWAQVLAATGWLRDHGGRGLYLRQVDAPGVDTKFVEQHRPLLADLLDVLLPPQAVDTRRSRTREFAPRYGFAWPEPLVRLRPGSGSPRLPTRSSEIGLRVDDLAALDLAPCRVLVVENEVTYLSVPPTAGELVVFGSGYTVGALGRVRWLAGCDLRYWGDLDTHGFAILNRLRFWFPQVRSLLMDRTTLLSHRDRWGREPSPTRARLEHLTVAEADLYRDLVEDVFGPAVRLEQERIAWSTVEEALGVVSRAEPVCPAVGDGWMGVEVPVEEVP